jgi:hypothetical protein
MTINKTIDLMKRWKEVVMGVCVMMIWTSALSQEFVSSGDKEIDAIRKSIKTDPTTGENFRERSVMMYMWLGAMQQ